jgi:myo-inositol-1(or 4)-monophosphatase
MTMDWNYVPDLVGLFWAVRTFLLDAGRNARQHVGVNPKGQESMGFDVGAEEAAAEFLRRSVPIPVRLLAEEQGEILIRPDLGHPAFTLIVDPVDGSENFERGLEMSCFSVAVLPVDAPLAPSGVVAGLVGHVFTGTYQTAIRGQGAFCGGQRLRTSSQAQLAGSMVALEIADDRPAFSARVRQLPERLLGLIGASARTRILGSTVLAQMGVADGGLEGYVDLRGILTPENFMAGALLVEEAGGVVSDGAGRPLPPWKEMTDGFTYIAAANGAVHGQILEAVKAG